MVDFNLLAVLVPILAGSAIGILTENIYIGAGGATVLLAWIAVETGNNFLLGAWLLVLTIMALSAGRFIATQMLGETA